MMNWHKTSVELPEFGKWVLGWWGDNDYQSVRANEYGDGRTDILGNLVYWEGTETVATISAPLMWANLPDRPVP